MRDFLKEAKFVFIALLLKVEGDIHHTGKILFSSKSRLYPKMVGKQKIFLFFIIF